MADEVTSKVKHIAALDFDISKAKKQLGQIEERLDVLTSKIASQNWSIKMTTDPNSEVGGYVNKISELQEKYDALQKEIDEAEKAQKEFSKKGVKSTSVLVGMLEHDLVNAFSQATKAAYDMAKTTEDSMVEIARVLNLTSVETSTMKTQMFELGQAYGRSFDEVADVTLRFAQAGYDMSDSLKMAENSLLALNTAELNSEEATQSLIGILNQWGYSADDLGTIIDKLNYTADNNAITTQDLVDALLKASSVAKTAGMSFDDTVGSLTALKVASGAAGKEVGNAFKSILSYIQRPESLKTFEEIGIDVYADKATGALKPMMEILGSMSEKWNAGAEAQNNMINTLIKSGDAAQMMSEEWAIATDSVEEYTAYQKKAAEATDLSNTAEARAQAQAAAGVFRRNYYISLMENFASAVSVSNDLVNAEGHSMEENGRYMETLTAKTEQLVGSLTELAVAAADSGLMDLAKSAIDTATAFTKWTTDTKNLGAVLTTVVGIITTLRSQKIASEITAIGGAFKSAWGGFQQVFTDLTGVETAASKAAAKLKGTAAAANAASVAINGIGLAVTAISIVIQVVNSITTAIHEARQEAIEAGKEAKKESDTLQELYEKYSQIRDIEEKTNEQEAEYRDLQKQIAELIGNRTGALDGLIIGTKAYTEELERQIIAEKAANQITLDNAVTAAEKEMKLSGFGGGIHGSYADVIGDPRNDVGAKILVDKGYATYSEGMSTSNLNLGGNNIENYALLKKAMEALEEEHTKLLKAGKAEEAENLTKGYTYKNVEKSYNLCKDSVEKYVNALVAQKEAEYVIANGMPETYAEQVKMNDVIFIRTGLTDDYRKQVGELTTKYYTAADAQRDFAAAMQSDEFKLANTELSNLAKNGELTATSFQYTTAAHGQLTTKMREFGYTIDDIVKYYNELYGAEGKVNGGAAETEETLGLTEDAFKALSTEIADSEKNISSLNGIIQTLNQGNSLTAEQVISLCETYGLLATQFTKTADGYTIEISALEQVRQAQIQAAETKRVLQLQDTYLVKTNVLERVKAYGLEIDSITSAAEAEAALLLLENERAKIANSINSNYDAETKVPQISDIDGVMESLSALRDAYTNVEADAANFYNEIGVKSENSAGKSTEKTEEPTEKTKESAEKTESALKSLTTAFQHLVDMGVYSTEEQIGYYEMLRRELNLTEEEYQSIEATLHNLYETQIKNNLDALKQESSDRIDNLNNQYALDKKATEKKYDDEKAARKQYYDDEIEALKDNLNTQISTAKSTYEAKKKYTDKYYSDQIDALQNLRDTETDNIKAIYNSQIDALNKIKEARKADRDTEDYDEKRAALEEKLSYWEQRTGTEAVTNVADIKKQIADLDKERKRDLEDAETDKQISSIEEQRDAAVTAAEKQYTAQINSLKAAQTSALALYEEAYSTESKMLQDKLDKEVKALEKARDTELDNIAKKKEAELERLETAKDEAIKYENEKWKAIEDIFNDKNIALIAAAGEYDGQLYQKFIDYFINPSKTSIDELNAMIADLENTKSAAAVGTGKAPTGSVASSIAGTSNYSGTNGNYTDKKSGEYSIGQSVKVSGTVHTSSKGGKAGVSYSGEKTMVNRIEDGDIYPYHVGSLGWVKESQLVKARTGGYTTADGLAMLHKDELIINPELVQGLKAIVDPKLLAGFRRAFAPETYSSVTNNNNYGGDSYNNGRSIVQNFNAPLQNIERVEDSTDLKAADNSLERMLTNKLNKLM